MQVLFDPVRARTAAIVAFALGSAYALYLFGTGFMLGNSDYWYMPRGEAGGTVDIRLALSGYYWFVLDDWRWPLFHIVRANGVAGTNATLVDVVPVLALAGKIVRSATGATLNLFPIWIAGTFALNATALAMLVRAMGQRSLLAAIVAAAIGALAPVIHHRFGHIALAAHWVFVLALAACIGGWPGRRGITGTAAALLGLCVLACAINLYLYVMTAAVAMAFVLQAVSSGRLPWVHAILLAVGILLAGAVPVWAFGMLENAVVSGVTIPFGEDSMNLMAPWWPQTSGMFNWTGIYWLTRGSIGATNGQYEGYSYLGLGAVLAVSMAAIRLGRRLPRLAVRHWPLALALLVLTIWAVSNRIYFGPVLIASYPLPEKLLTTVLAWFRAEGRFFWPVAWTIAALGIAGTLSVVRRRTALILAVGIVAVQWADLSIWRARLHATVTSPPVSVFGSLEEARAIESELARRGRVVAIPSMTCNANGGGDYIAPATVGAVELQLMAARNNATMPAIALARNGTDCTAERTTPLTELAGTGLLVVFAQPGTLDRRPEALVSFNCRTVAVGLVCGRP